MWRYGIGTAERRLYWICIFPEAPMDAPRRVYRLIQLDADWYWRLDIMNDDGMIGPFISRDEAEKDARETLGIAVQDT